MVKNVLIRKGLRRYSPSALRYLRGRPKLTKPKAAAPAAVAPTTVAPAAVKPAQTKAVKKHKMTKIPSMRNILPLTDRRKRTHRAWVRNPPKLRASITPGTVLIMLAGRFRGKRVVFLKQLPSGLLLITGPFKLNGVPLRRVCQNYVIATSTKVPVKGLKINPKQINDLTFSKRAPLIKQKKSRAAFFAMKKNLKKGVKPVTPAPAKKSAEKPPKKKQKKVEAVKLEEYKKKRAERKAAKGKAKEAAAAPKEAEKKKKTIKRKLMKVSHERAALQKAIDSQILPAIKKIPLLRNYLTSRFSLQNHEHPHMIKF